MEETAKPARRHWLNDPLRVERVPSLAASSHLIGFASNVSETGMFLQCVLPPPAGTNMTLHMRIGQNADVRVCGAEVVWVRDRETTPFEPTGVGVKLGPMEEDSKERWVEFCRRQGRSN